jgi:HK97 family phage prohead protease
MGKEIRNLESQESEIRVSKRGRVVEGYAIIFNKKSKDLGGFKEIILPEAVNGLVGRSDVLALLNHSVERGVLARSTNGSGTLKLEPDKNGVMYTFEAPNTTLGDEVVEGVRRGDIRTSSFAFAVAQGGDKWVKQDDASYLRTITNIDQLYDVSPVYREAYSDTTVAIRSLDAFKKDEIPEATVNPDPAKTESGNLPVAKRILSDEEKYMRQLNYKFKITNR